MSDTNGYNNPRMNRIEKALELMINDHEQFRYEHKQLLIAQVVQSDQIAASARQIEALAKTTTQQAENSEALDTRVDRLVSSIGELISRIRPRHLLSLIPSVRVRAVTFVLN